MNRTGTLSVRQSGMVLVISMMLLLILTVMGIAGANMTLFQEKMVAVSLDMTTSFQAAESALRDAEQWVDANYSAGDAAWQSGRAGETCRTICAYSHAVWMEDAVSQTPGWYYHFDWQHHARRFGMDYSINPAIQRVVITGLESLTDDQGIPLITDRQPRYVIEKDNRLMAAGQSVGDEAVLTHDFYRITALGYGRSATTRTYLQSGYQMPRTYRP